MKLEKKWLVADEFDTPLGKMIAIADEKALYGLQFADGCDFCGKAEKGRTAPIDLIEEELQKYFVGGVMDFQTPMEWMGTPFQKAVWKALCSIPFGATRSYSEMAQSIHRPDSVRAVARANASNRFVIIVPCHRVILADGNLGGYNGGVERKKWLLQHEKQEVQT